MVDLKMTEDGELVLSGAGDLMFVYGDEQLAQEILFRLKTTKGDWTLSPTVGCNLEDFIGQPNVSFTWAAIEVRVANALAFDQLLLSPQVDCVSIGQNEVLISVVFGSQETDNRTIQILSGLDLRKGLVFSRVNVQDI